MASLWLWRKRRRRIIRAVVFAAALVAPLVPGPARTTPIGGWGELRVGTSYQKGIDVCSAPSASTMSTWWYGSPYYDLGIYIGGSSRGCSQPNLTPTWAQSSHSLGWGNYLIWVGPQAPCTSFPSRFSYDGPTAFAQGVGEANRAVAAAQNLGFTGTNIYYYDLEAFNTGSSSCRTAAQQFVNGWVQQLRFSYHQYAAMYGSGCGSAVSDWATSPTPPDDVWIADWNGDPDVWGLRCVSNGIWIYGQRLHQWRGGHNETWGGVTLNVDNDCADGLITPHGHGWADSACVQE